MEWPQITMIVLYAINILVSAALHGMPKTGKNNVLATIIGTGLGVWILYEGGFWT